MTDDKLKAAVEAVNRSFGVSQGFTGPNARAKSVEGEAVSLIRRLRDVMRALD